jgi:flagellar hook-associated protein 3 FlgL
MKRSQLLIDLSRLQNDVFLSQRVLTTGSEIEKSSDNPSDASRIMLLRNSSARRDQHLQNISDGIARMSYNEIQLNYAEDLLTEARTIALTASNGSTTDSDRASMAERIDGMLFEMLSIANSHHEGQYIFGGFNTQDPPYEAVYDPGTGDAVAIQDQPQYMDGEIFRLTSDGQQVRTNVPGKEVFITNATGDDGDLFQILIDLRDALRDGIDNDETQQREMDPLDPLFDPLASYSDAEQFSLDTIQGTLERIDEASERVRNVITRIGTDVQRLQATEERHRDVEVKESEHLGKTQGADLTEWISKFQMQTLALQQAMQVGSQVLGSTLVNFLS